MQIPAKSHNTHVIQQMLMKTPLSLDPINSVLWNTPMLRQVINYDQNVAVFYFNFYRYYYLMVVTGRSYIRYL